MAYLHGSTELLDHLKAAQALSDAKRALVSAENLFMLDPVVHREETLVGAQQDVENARLVLRAAYKLYTNPFDVQKTV